MNAFERNGSADFSLSKEELIVLFDWLVRFNQNDQAGLFESDAEKRVLWDLEARIEKVLPSVVAGDFRTVLAKDETRDELMDRGRGQAIN